MVTLYATCTVTGCKNHGREISKTARSSNYTSTDGRLKTRTNIVCPSCRNWAAITKIEEVPRASKRN